MKKNLLWMFLSVIMLALACTPAQSVSGTYNGTFSGSGLSVTSGSGSLVITEQGENNVTIVFKSAGNPDIHMHNVGVTRIGVLGINVYDFQYSDGSVYVSGSMYENTHMIDLSYSYSDTTSLSFSFSGSK